jgi:phosphoglycerol transferase MdoB-like AlkP superfamily enzyme
MSKWIKENLSQKPNITIVILESLVSPKNIFKKIQNLPDEKFNWEIVKSSTFAGESARSEFEILCGTESYKNPVVEFNIIYNKKPCLPNILKSHGYETLVTNANRPWMYNALRAYKHLGFNQIFWPKYDKDFKNKDLPGGYLFDGSLFKYNLSKVKKIINKPVLNYIVGAHGHVPYERNEKKRPSIFDHENTDIKRIVNIHHYREIEIKKYLEELDQIHKNHIFILCGDHLPYIQGFEHSNKFSTFCISNSFDKINKLYDYPYKIMKKIGCKTCIRPKNFSLEYQKIIP